MYLTVAQIYLSDNALLREPLTVEHVKPRLLGHWGTSPGLAFVYAHVSRMVRETDQQAIYLAGPGHGGPALVAAAWLEGTYSEVYPQVSRDEAGAHRLVRQFSTPGGIPSHVSVTTPGSIHEGGELGYVLVHAFGAVMDNPDLLAVAVVGDGEAETGPLEGSWKGISFLNPVHDGAVPPVLHLNDARISGPTVLGRKDPAEVRALFAGHGYDVVEVNGSDLPGMHHRFAAALVLLLDADPPDPGRRARRRVGRQPPALADDRAAQPQGLDGAPRGGRRRRRGHLPLPPGTARRRPREPGAPGDAGDLAEVLPS
jgi:xylulose-5-phosphate/fructose-6-phosphate phosphoketolase